MRRSDSLEGEVFDDDLALVIPDVQIALASIEQIVDALVVDLQVADAHRDAPLDHGAG